MRALRVDPIADSGQQYGGRAFNDGLHEAMLHHVPIHVAQCGDRWATDDGVTLSVLSPCGALFADGKNDVNENSVVVMLAYRDFRMLFMGDAGFQAEQRLLDSGVDVRSDVLKAGHHGSAYSSAPGFIRRRATRRGASMTAKGHGPAIVVWRNLVLYVIRPGCQGPNGEALALAFVPPGWVVVQDASTVTDSLLWQAVYDTKTGGFALVSLWSIKNGQPRAVSMIYGSGGKLLSMPLKQYGLQGATLWRATSDGDTLTLNSLQNGAFMNIAGNGPWPPGTTVQGTIGGYNGASNEVWMFSPYGTDSFPWTYTFAPECAPGTLLSASASDPGGQLTIETPSAAGGKPGGTQLWAGTYVIEEAEVLGAVFVNYQLQMLMRTTPNTGGAVFTADLSELDQWSAWRVADAPAAGLSAVHSAGSDDLTVNVQGPGPYGPGNVVITSKSQGGKTNEQWAITSLPQKTVLDGMVSDETYEAELKRLTAED